MSMLDLSTLVFKVDTAQLVQAKKDTDALTESQRGLAAALAKGAGQSGNTGRGQPQNNNKPVKDQISLLEKLDNLYKDLASGSTRWEASQLRAARQIGIPLQEVRQQLADIRKLSQDPFDSAIGSVRSITQHFEQLQNRLSLTNEGLILTAKQLREFSRIPFEVEGQMRSGGKDPKGADNSEYLRRIKEEEQIYIQTARSVNELTSAEKERSNVIKQNAAAHKFLAAEMQRVDNVLGEMNSQYGINAATQERSAAAVAKYASMLQRAGISGEQASIQLEKYRRKVQEVANADQKRAMERLSNALAPQISDVAVSIAGGMPLHLIVMQQGLQIRDLIGQSRVDLNNLNATFATSMQKMGSSLIATIGTLGTMFVGGLVSMGNAVVGFGAKVTGLNAVMSALDARFPSMVAGLTAVRVAMSALAGIGIVAVVAAVAALTVEAYKMIAANNNMARSLAGSEGSFRANYDSVQKYVLELNKLGVSSKTAAEVITEMANVGNLTASQIIEVTQAAVDLERYGNVAIKDTVKQFSEMAKDPVKALTELAIKTGEVSPEVVKLARELREKGESSKAAALGFKELSSALSRETQSMKKDLFDLTYWFAKMSEGVDKFFAKRAEVRAQWESNKAQQPMREQEREVQIAQERVNRAVEGGGSSSLIEYRKQELKVQQEKLSLLKTEEAFAQRQLGHLQAQKEERSRIAKLDSTAAEDKLKFMSKISKAQKELDELEIAYKNPRKTITKSEYEEKKRELQKSLEGTGGGARRDDYFEKLTEKINDAQIQLKGVNVELNIFEKMLKDLPNDKDFLAFTKKNPEQSKDILERVRYLGLEARAVQESIKADEEKKKAIEALDSLKRKESIHGEAYEKMILSIANARKLGAIATDEEADALRRLAKEQLSESYKYSKRKEQEDKDSAQKINVDRSDLEFEKSTLGKTDRTKELMRIEYEQKKKFLDLEYEYTKEMIARGEKEDADAYKASVERATEAFLEKRKLIEDTSNFQREQISETAERQKNFDAIAKRGFESMGDALVDFAVTGKSSFGDMVKQMLIDLAKLEIRMQMMKIYEGIRGGGEGGFLGTVLGGIKSLFFADGAAFHGGMQKFADGGAFTNSIVSKPTAFNMGVMGEAGPEAIIPLKRGRDGSLGIASSGGSNVQIVIVNNSGESVKKKESIDSRGNRRVELTVGEMVAGETQRSGSSVQNSVGQTFGLKPALLAR